jgi:beta-glucanase (GH16 family)
MGRMAETSKKTNRNKLARAKGFWFALVFASVGGYFVWSSFAATTWKLVWQEEFSGTSLNSTSWMTYQGPENHSQAIYTADNVSVSNDLLTLKTRRHCVAGDSEALTSANAQADPCPAGKLTKYSSGQVRTLKRWKNGRIEIRARLPAAQKGQWPALWMRNQTDWCKLNYGELDIVEWYYDKRVNGSMQNIVNRNSATTHATCDPTIGPTGTTKSVKHYEDFADDLTKSFHIFAVEWDTTSVRYEMDGKMLRSENRSSSPDGDIYKTSAADFPISIPRFTYVTDQTWELRIQTQVIKQGDAYHSPPDNSQPFATRGFLVSWVRAYSR